jgi:hypothetical protein
LQHKGNEQRRIGHLALGKQRQPEETKRLLDVLDKQLEGKQYVVA